MARTRNNPKSGITAYNQGGKQCDLNNHLGSKHLIQTSAVCGQSNLTPLEYICVLLGGGNSLNKHDNHNPLISFWCLIQGLSQLSFFQIHFSSS